MEFACLFLFFFLLVTLRRALQSYPASKMASSPSEVNHPDKLHGDKSENYHQEVIHDHDVTGKAAEAEASNVGHLTEEEKAVEKKLRRKIDSLIMPLVILVGVLTLYTWCASFANTLHQRFT